MSPRTYARRFRETTGTTPLQWLCAERVRRAQDLLENTDDTIERINITLPRRVLRRLDDMARTTGQSRSGLVARLTVTSATKDIAPRAKRRA